VNSVLIKVLCCP